MPPRPLAAILTLGCKLNLADSEAIARGLRAAGYDVVDRLCEADAFILNTCSVTHVADQKSRRLIRSARRLSPDATVGVTGCFPQTAGFDRARELGADVVVGTADSDRAALVEFLAERAMSNELRATSVLADARGTGAGPDSSLLPPPSSLHTRAFIRAQTGCNDVCAFCIVPRTRGREESVPIGTVVAEVNRAVESGAREAVITGTQLGAWGRDLEPGLQPHDLIAAILERTDIVRLRFSSLQPRDITPELLALWADPRLMPHFHLALQSGSNAVLARMRRRYTLSEYLRAVAFLRSSVPGVAVTTDVIAGFPNETDEEFEATLAACREAGFARMHCFPYSLRSRTAAVVMPGQVAPQVRQERVQRLIALGEELSQGFREGIRNTIRPVLWEHQAEAPRGRQWLGHTDNYVPAYAEGAALGNRVTPALLGPVYHDGVLATLPGGVA